MNNMKAKIIGFDNYIVVLEFDKVPEDIRIGEVIDCNFNDGDALEIELSDIELN